MNLPIDILHYNMEEQSTKFCDLTVTKKIQDIRRLINVTDKDSKVKRELETRLDRIIVDTQKLRSCNDTENIAPLIVTLSAFKYKVVQLISKSPKIGSPSVKIHRLENSQMNLSNQSVNEDDSSDEDLFEPVLNGSTQNSPLPEKRVRKQILRPDFISDFKSIKLERKSDSDTMDTEKMSPPSVNGNDKQLPEFPCPVCRKIFRKKGHMTRHLLTHEPEKPFPCDFCEKRFAAKYSLQMHLLNRHNTDAKPFECTECDKRFTLKKELDQHVESHKDGGKIRNFPCHHCDLRFKTQEDVDTHLKCHPDNDSVPCSHCDKTFPHKNALIRHEKTHSSDKSYTCSVCNKVFGTKNGLQMHLQSHEDENNKILPCSMCPKKFSVEQNLELHVAFHEHEEDRPFSCNVCEVRFKTQERLSKHFETHGSGGEKIYPCSYCEKTFPRKYNLVRHELSHTHGRRKPKDGMPVKIHDDSRVHVIHNHTNNHHKDEEHTDEETANSVDMSKTTEECSMNGFLDSADKNFSFVYNCVSKSNLFSEFFVAEEVKKGDGLVCNSNNNTFRVLKFEEY